MRNNAIFLSCEVEIGLINTVVHRLATYYKPSTFSMQHGQNTTPGDLDGSNQPVRNVFRWTVYFLLGVYGILIFFITLDMLSKPAVADQRSDGESSGF